MGLLVLCRAGAQDEEPKVEELYRIFHRHCVRCHGGHLERAKGGFSYVLDFQRMRDNPDLIVPGKPDRSEVYLLMSDPDPDLRMPPGSSDVPPVSTEDLELIRKWIAEGAKLEAMQTKSDETTSETDAASSAQPPPRKEGKSLTAIIGATHPMLIHFPIALLICALVAEGLRYGTKKNELVYATRLCLWLGLLSFIPAGISGFLSADVSGYTAATVGGHRNSGIAAAVLAFATCIALELSERRHKGGWIMWILLVLAVIVVSMTGHLGGVIVHGKIF